MSVDKLVSAVFGAVCQNYDGRPISRSCITSLARELGQLPEIGRMCRDFGDMRKYPVRPMITLRETMPAIYLLGWREGDFTDIHDHGDCEVGIYVIQGVVTEDIFACGPLIDKERSCLLAVSRQIKQGESATCLSTYVHRMGNLFPEVAATLHVYGPSLEDMILYEATQSGNLSVHSTWHHQERAQH